MLLGDKQLEIENKIKGYYFSQLDKKNLGPLKKVENQIKAMKKNGIDLTLVESPYCLDGKIRGNFILRQLICRLPFTYVYSKHIYQPKFQEADVYYIRFSAGDFYFIRFLKQLRKNNPTAKIVMELSDYPTTCYMTISLLYKIVYFPLIIKDLIARKYYRKYINRIATLEPIKKIYGIKTLSFRNGIDVESVKMKKACHSKKIKIIAVAAMFNFHGYERLIEGIRQYRDSGGSRSIELHLIGGREAPGNELLRYIELCNRYRLNDRIFFYGEKKGKELDDLYDSCNVAAASFGMYKLGYQVAGSLKVREYLAKGLPIITGCKLDVCEGRDFSYICEFANDDSLIDMEKVICFFDKVYEEREEAVIDSIRIFAMKYCDMSYAMKRVIDYFKGNER